MAPPVKVRRSRIGRWLIDIIRIDRKLGAMPPIHVATPDRQRFEHDEQEVRKLYASGALPPGSLYWKQGMAEWRPLNELIDQQPSMDSPGSFRSPTDLPPQRQQPGAFPAPQTSGLAITSAILGVLSLFFSLFTAIPAIIVGHMALANIKRPGNALGGRGLAITGLVFGYLCTLLILVLILVMIVIAALGHRPM